MTAVRVLAVTIVTAFTADSAHPAAPEFGLQLPTNFEVKAFAGPDLANDIYVLHVSRDARVVVAGRGYVRELADTNGDGKADRAVELVTGLRDGPMGLLLENDTLHLVADGGLKRLLLRPGRPADMTEAAVVLPVKTGGEHDAHAVRRGPDGWLYLLCGNMAGVSARTITAPGSPIKSPVAGCLVRVSPDGAKVEVVADGFRNPYDFDFHPDGSAFTYDSDNERCVGLPWYEPTRFYRIVPGGHHGWLSPHVAQTWRRPPYFWDVVPPVATAGRGSPTGVCCYDHGAFPARYRGGFFLADWTFGRILFARPQSAAGGDIGTAETFAQAVGDAGFAPTGLAVHPSTGDLFVSTGGRGTRGAVYRIRSTDRGQDRPRPQPPQGGEELRTLLTAERDLTAIGSDRAAALVRVHAGSDDRLVRQAIARLVARLPESARQELRGGTKSDTERVTHGFAAVGVSPEVARRIAITVLTSPTARPADQLDAVRLLQVALGDLTDPKSTGGAFEGYTPRVPIERGVARTTAASVRPVYPTGHRDLDRELSRTLAMLADDDPAAAVKVAAALTADSDPVEDVHGLLVLARLKGRGPGLTRTVADALLRLVEKAEARSLPRDRHWPLRLAAIAGELAKRDPELSRVLIESPRFGAAGHVVFTALPGIDRAAAARRFLARAAHDPEFGWLSEHVKLLGELPSAEARPAVVKLWDRGGLEDALIPFLARNPAAADRGKFMIGLRSPQPGTVAIAAKALAGIPGAADGGEIVALVRALRSLPPAETVARRQVVAALRKRTGSDVGADDRAWVEWVERNRPELAKGFAPAAAGVGELRKRLAKVDWSAGDPTTGRAVFARACAACHNGSQAVGPSLEGIAARFSRDDLVTAVIEPNRDVPPRYRATKVITDDGKTYQGVVIYEANDGLILQTGATDTIRIAGPRVVAKQQVETSLMPGGLLDSLSDREIADLFAYLKVLGPPGRDPARK
jgi:putative heme-binding domain-containing protein